MHCKEKRPGNLCWTDGKGEAVSGVAVLRAQVQEDKKHCGAVELGRMQNPKFPPGTPQQPLRLCSAPGKGS